MAPRSPEDGAAREDKESGMNLWLTRTCKSFTIVTPTDCRCYRREIRGGTEKAEGAKRTVEPFYHSPNLFLIQPTSHFRVPDS